MMGGYSRLEPDAPLGRRIGRGLAAFVMIAGAFYALLGLARLSGLDSSTREGGAITASSQKSAPKPEGVNWIWNDEAAANALAASSGKPIIMDFWADWCTSCQELDHKTFNDPRVQTLINDRFIALKMDGSKITADVKQGWTRHGVKGLPTVLLLSPVSGAERARFEAFQTADQILPLLESVLAK